MYFEINTYQYKIRNNNNKFLKYIHTQHNTYKISDQVNKIGK